MIVDYLIRKCNSTDANPHDIDSKAKALELQKQRAEEQDAAYEAKLQAQDAAYEAKLQAQDAAYEAKLAQEAAAPEAS